MRVRPPKQKVISSVRRDLLICLTLFITTMALYWQATAYDYINFDDPEYIANNVAEALGMTVEELKSLREDGQSLEDLGYTQEELREIFEQAKEDAIEQALADGVITEEQLENFQNRPEGRPEGNSDESPGSFTPFEGQPAEG